MVQLFCSWPENWANDIAAITSCVSSHGGTWEGSYHCPTNYFISFRALIVQDRGAQDDLGIFNVEFQCRGSGMHGTSYVRQSGVGVTEQSQTWGDWPASSCPLGSAVCSIQTRIDNSEWLNKKAVTDLNLRCCEH